MKKSAFLRLRRLLAKFRDDAGQGMTEYIIIVALIAIGTIAAVTLFGNNVQALFSASADALNGTQNVTAQTNASKSNDYNKTLKTFGQTAP